MYKWIVKWISSEEDKPIEEEEEEKEISQGPSIVFCL